MEECDIENYVKGYKRSLVPGSKMAVYVTKDSLGTLRTVFNITSAPKLTEFRYMGSFYCVYIEVNDMFSLIFTKKLQQLVEAGLIEYNMRYYYDEIDPKRWEVESEPKVLTLEELEAGFVVCMLPLAISAVVFCLEWLITLKNYFVIFFIFKKMFEVRLSIN